MKKILIIGAGILQLPAIKRAKELGLNVAVVDMSSNAPGIPLADKFYEVSTNDIDGILKVSAEYKPDGVMTLATDMPMRSVAAVAERFGLYAISSDVAIRATDKIEMIKCFASKGVPHPWFEVISSENELNNILLKRDVPYIMKPNDSSGSRGVVLVNDKKDAEEAFRYSKSVSRSGLVLVEEYMQGPEVSVETITIKGETTVLAVTDKLTTGAPYFVEMGHSQPSQLPDNIVERIKEVAIKAVESIGIDNSPAHIEIIVTNDGPKLVELGARLGGDCITTYLVPLSTGINLIDACISLSIGSVPDIRPKFKKAAAIRYANCDEGILVDVNGLDSLKDDPRIKHVEIVKGVGEKVTIVKGSGDRVGYVIAQDYSPAFAIDACNLALNKLQFKVK